MYTKTPTTYCCQSAGSCSYTSSSSWNCSNSYNSSIYAMYLCPFIEGNCGANQSIGLNNTGDSVSITATLTSGNTCVYKVQSQCGLPQINFNSTYGFDIWTAQYDQHD